MSSKTTILLLGLFLLSCDKGLSPDLAQIKAGFGGTITFTGEWDKEVNHTHIVLFKDPLLSKEDFNVFNLKYVSDSIPSGTNFYDYSTLGNSLIENIEPGDYAYLAVAQSKTELLSLNREDWTIVGVYYNNDSAQPATLTIPEGVFVNSVNIVCDFNNPPPQPPGNNNLDKFLNKLLYNAYFNHKENNRK